MGCSVRKIIAVVFIAITMASCIADTPKNENVESSSSIKQEDEYPVYIAWVDELKLREEPNRTSKVLYAIKENEELLYLNEKTDFKETIAMRGKNYRTEWFKVRVENGLEGWAFGGGLKAKKTTSNNDGDNRIKKNISGLSSKSMAKILNLEVSDLHTYSGYYHCYLTANGVEILDGEFEVMGENPDCDGCSDTYTGNYINGTKDGDFTEIHNGMESGATTVLHYDASNVCSWGTLSSGNEVEYIKEYKVLNPDKCTFSFIYEHAQKHGTWQSQ